MSVFLNIKKVGTKEPYSNYGSIDDLWLTILTNEVCDISIL